MNKLVCEICGGALVMNANNIAECENCGMKYAKEKVAQMIKIDGAVEITKGEAEKERLLKNAETFIKLGKLSEAEEISEKICDEYPDDYRVWYTRFKVSAIDNDYPPATDDYLKTALELVENKQELEEEAYAFWWEALNKGDFPYKDICHYAKGDYTYIGPNHVVTAFAKKAQKEVDELINQLNSSLDKKKVFESLGTALDGYVKGLYSYYKHEYDKIIAVDSFHIYCDDYDGPEYYLRARVQSIRENYVGTNIFGNKKYKKSVCNYDENICRLYGYNGVKELVNIVNKINV